MSATEKLQYRKWWYNEAPINEGLSKKDYYLKKYPPTKYPPVLPSNVPFNLNYVTKTRNQSDICKPLTQEEMIQQYEGGGCGSELYNRSNFY